MNAPSAAAVSSPVSGRAIASFVLGLLGLIMCQVLSPVAWVLGWLELRDIRSGLAPDSGRDFAMAGMVLGIIGSALLALAVLIVGVVLCFIIAALAAAGSLPR